MTEDDAILKQLGARVREERAETSAPPGIPAFDAAAEERIAARLLGKPPGVVIRPNRWMWVAGPVAAAAAIALFVATRGGAPGQPPSYELSLVSASQMRAPSSAKTNENEFSVDPDGELELVARPSAPVKGASARAVLIGPGGAQPWIVPLDISDEGAVRISGTTRSLFPGTTGSFEVVLFIAVGDALPTQAEALHVASGRAPVPTSSRVLRSTVRFVEKQ